MLRALRSLGLCAEALWFPERYAMPMLLMDELCVARVDRELRYIISEIDSGCLRKIWQDPHPPVPQIIAMAFGVGYESAVEDFWELMTLHIPEHRQMSFSLVWDLLEASAGVDLNDLQFDGIEQVKEWLSQLAGLIDRHRA